jgi:hypothetical protein
MKKAIKKERFLIFTDMSEEEASTLLCSDAGTQKRLLRKHFYSNFKSLSEDQQGILAEYYFKVLKFCEEEGFSIKNTSTLLSIMNEIFSKSLWVKNLSEDDLFEMFKDLLLLHSIQRPPHSLAIFTLDDVKKSTSFFITNYYRVHSAFQYAFQNKEELSLFTFQNSTRVIPQTPDILTQKEVKPDDFPRLQEYLPMKNVLESRFGKSTPANREVTAKNVEKVLEIQMAKLQAVMDEKMKEQDEQFLAEME